MTSGFTPVSLSVLSRYDGEAAFGGFKLSLQNVFSSIPLLKGIGDAVDAGVKMIYRRLKWKHKCEVDVWVLSLPEIEGIHC